MDHKFLFRRVAAYFIDLILICILLAVYVYFFGGRSSSGQLILDHTYGRLEMILLAHLYYIVQEYFFQQTIGKRFFQLKVQKINGGSLSLKDVLLRNLLNTIELFLLPIIAFLVVFLSKNHQRIGDLLAQTIVTDKNTSNKSN